MINLALLTGHVGKYGSGLNPLRGQNNVQGSGDMGALPYSLVGYWPIDDPTGRQLHEKVWGVAVPEKEGLHLTQMLDAMGRKEIKALYVIGENPIQSDADANHTQKMFEGLEFLVVQDILMTPTAQMADIVLPAASWGENDGTYTNSERRNPTCSSSYQVAWRGKNGSFHCSRYCQPDGSKLELSICGRDFGKKSVIWPLTLQG